jgi:urease accessory protein
MNHHARRLRLFQSSLLALVVLLLPALAHAHVGIGLTSGWVHGFAHPISGLDHVCAMVAVGLLAAGRGERAVWVLPLTFLTLMAFGALLGMTAISVPLVEQGVVMSVLVLGVLVAAAARLPLVAEVVIVMLFAVCHGHVHGTEMTTTASGVAYGAGFLAGTALLHAVGIGIALFPRGIGDVAAARLAGAVIAVCGVYLYLA